MPFIDLNPSPVVTNDGSNTQSATTPTLNPAGSPVTVTPAAQTAGSTEPSNDLLSRLKSFTNLTKDELPAEGENGLPALEDKSQPDTNITLNPNATPMVADSMTAGSMPEVQEFAGPDFPTQDDDNDLTGPQQSLDQKLVQVNNEMSNLVPEVAAATQAESSTPMPAVSPTPPQPEVSETPVDNDVSDDVVIGTESSTPAASTDEMVQDIPAQMPEPQPEVQIEPQPQPTAQVDTASVPDSTGSEAPTDTAVQPENELPTNLPGDTENVNAETPVSNDIAITAEQTAALAPIPGEGQTVDSTLNQNLSDLQLQVKVYSLDELLREALSKGASDVHLNVGYRAIARIDGDLTPLQSQVLTNEMIQEMLVPVVAHKGDIPLESVYDLDIAYALPDKSARFRVNVYREKESFAAVFRLIPEQIRTIEELYLPSLLRQFTDLEQGLILVTGATGSGKSTTIAALVNEINQAHPKHIVTIEDPIEYLYPPGRAVVSQRNVGEDTVTWEDAMRSVLRQDPNVVVIGEMRDLETISAAMTVAETGHLVFATLHTNSAAQSVDRIIDVFPEYQQNQIRTQLANVLTAVVCQKLLPISEGGRRVAVEIMLANPAVRAAIREHKVYQIDNMIQTSADVGMISMEKSLYQMVKDGLISPEVAQQYANKPGDLLTLMK